MASAGAAVTGVDADQENVAAASAYAAGAGLGIDYRCGDVAQLGLTGFDLVTSLEVIEQVAGKAAFDSAPGAVLVMGDPSGIAWSLTKGLHLSDDLALDYIVTVTGAD